ncbi:hypothetical protein H0G86_000857 [Trichoderma simmonsii]|uniref:Uncharacterized protein n=1 Tax=Trichoderma simmonsii TaxID=1491479 RepID=A0A8G0PAM5_9HYPO|nr:hypothetical protein H0G86_000857 [Trichoderma simmonsii]
MQTGPPRAAFRINGLVPDNGCLSTTAPSALKQCPVLVHKLACARDGFNTMRSCWSRLRMAIWANAGADHRRELKDQQESPSFICHEKQKVIAFPFFPLLQVWMTNTVGDTTHLSR